MAIRRLPNSWAYDFQLDGYGRHRKGGFRTKAEAEVAERRAREALLLGKKRITMVEAFDRYVAATTMKDRSRDSITWLWKERIEPELGHLYIEEVRTSTMDKLKQGLPKHLAPAARNRHLEIVRAVLRFMWKREELSHVPYVPMESKVRPHRDWYTEAERDRLLGGIFEQAPEWYCFFYLTARLGLRRGEVYAIEHRQIRNIPAQLVVDQALQVGTKSRPAKLVTRKNAEAYVLGISQDVVDAIKWHIREGHAGKRYLFSKDGTFPVYLDSYKRSLLKVQRALGLRELGHHAIGRHSVASQAVTNGVSIKAVQAQLGHRSEQSTHVYAHLGSKAQLRLVEGLRPKEPPHGIVREGG